MKIVEQYVNKVKDLGYLPVDVFSITIIDEILELVQVNSFKIEPYVRNFPLLLLHNSIPKSNKSDTSTISRKIKESVVNCQSDLNSFQAQKIEDRKFAIKIVNDSGIDWKIELPKLSILMNRSFDLPPYQDRLFDVHELINSISPTFCLAKWEEVTYLSNEGYSLSCCKARKNPMGDVTQNIEFFHNSLEKIEVRKALLAGEKHPECDFCWIKEDSFMSERVIYSEWHLRWFYDIVESGLGEDYVPSSVGLTSTQTCQLKCMYCSPQYSTSWESEIKQQGSYKLVKYDYNRTDYDVGESKNMDLFWKLWPKWKKKVNKITITGGEPLLSKDTWLLMDSILDGTWKPLSFVINTNLDVPEKLIDNLIKQTEKIPPGVLTIATSGEAYGKALEYTRFGIDCERWMNNVKRFLRDTSGVRIKLMTSVNVLSYSTFDELVNQFLSLRDTYGDRVEKITFKYLVSPMFLDARLLPDDVLDKFKLTLLKIRDDSRLMPIEQVSIDNLIGFLSTKPDDLERQRKNMMMFFKEYDQRRGTLLKEVFPELNRYD